MAKGKVDKPTVQLPPDPLPPLPDPCFGGQPGPYAESALRDVCGARINPDAKWIYSQADVVGRREVGIMTCFDPKLPEILDYDVYGFDPRSVINQPAPSQWPLSVVMPRIVVYGPRQPFPLDPNTYVIFYKDLHSNPKTLPNREWLPKLRERFPEGTKLVLSFQAGRELVNHLWGHRDFWQQPFLDQFDAVIAPDFSAFSNDPKPQSLRGERMHQIFAQEGSKAGRTVIPAIAWLDEDSLRRQVELWVSQYPKINTIVFDCDGTHVDPIGWKWRNLFAIEKHCAPYSHIRWILSGISAGWHVRELNRIFPAKNYCLIPSVSLYVNAMQSSPDPAYRAMKFRQRIKQLERFRSGEEVADPEPRPDHWPTFAEVRRVQE